MINVEEIKEAVSHLNIDDDENSLVTIAAVIVLYSLFNDTKSVQKIKKGTGYYMSQVELIFANLWKNGVIKNYRWNLEYINGEIIFNMEQTMELTIVAMCGAGELKTSKYQNKDPRFV